MNLLKYFFTNKSFLPADIPGKLFSPLHLIVAAIFAIIVVLLAIFVRKLSVRKIKTIFFFLWIFIVVYEITKITWETATNPGGFFVQGILPLYPCSIFMYVMPFIIWFKKESIPYRCACAFMCTIGLIGGLINFVYPQNVLSNYSCLSFAGLHTLIYHGSMVFVALVLLLSRQYDYKNIKDGFLAVVPLLITAIPATIVNYVFDASYLFLRGGIPPFNMFYDLMPTPLYKIVLIVAYMLAGLIFYAPYWIYSLKNKKKAD